MDNTGVMASHASVESPQYAENALYGILSNWKGLGSDKDQGLLDAEIRRRIMQNGVTDETGLWMGPERAIAQVQYDLHKLTSELGEEPREMACFGSPIAATVLVTCEGIVEVYQTEEVTT